MLYYLLLLFVSLNCAVSGVTDTCVNCTAPMTSSTPSFHSPSEVITWPLQRGDGAPVTAGVGCCQFWIWGTAATGVSSAPLPLEDCAGNTTTIVQLYLLLLL